jgi:AraC-like DNA-binding protein
MTDRWVMSSALHGAEELLAELGVEASALLDESGVPAAALKDLEIPLTAVSVGRFHELAVKHSRCRNFGLLLSDYQSGEMLGPLWTLVKRSNNLEAALRRLEDYSGFYGTAAHLHLSCDETGLAFLHFDVTEGLRPVGAVQAVEAGLAILLRELCSVLGERFEPVSILLRHGRPEDTVLHHKVFGSKIEFNSFANAIVFPAKLLETLLLYHDSDDAVVIERELRRRVPRNPLIIKSRAELIIRTMMPYMPCTLAKLASEMSMSSRTLQGRLALCGSSFQQLRDAVRMDLARKYLLSADHSIAQVADLLQFSESSAFIRFFKAHQGITPLRFRSHHHLPQV